MIVKLNNDEIVRVDKIIRDETTIEGYIHGRKSTEFVITYDNVDEAKRVIGLITSAPTYIDIPSINFQIKNS